MFNIFFAAESVLIRVFMTVKGIVQGVGFRPFVHRLVREYGFRGWVRNSSAGAELELEGERGELYLFAERLRTEHPPLALVESVELTELSGLRNYSGFEIIGSRKGERVKTLISPDVGICPDCLRELRDPADRRYGYPFINCTNCGPRFTIIKSVPYDRAFTSMGEFPMCADCRREFEDIEDRRYHAQPNCCPACGPSVFFLDAAGERLPGDAIDTARRHLKAGRIICVKGLGGMHLCALPEAAGELRRRKERDDRPFAVMCADTESARRMCLAAPEEAAALEGFRRPIVLLQKRERGSYPELSENGYIGVMLPYTPLHCLLLGQDIKCLIMTSANLSDTPIIYKNREALEKLSGIADGYLLHDREILTRCDDSLIRLYRGREYPLRRSRGYVPYPVSVPGISLPILACGAEQKASFCFSAEGRAFPSQHMGDLKNIETLAGYESQIEHFSSLLDIRPRLLACDMHPDYMSTDYAEKRSKRDGVPLIRVQHHHAHMAACMADNGLEGRCLGLVWDGVGYGTDGSAWGGELLCGDYSGFARFGSIRPLRLPGGDRAVREIWRVAASLLEDSGIEQRDALISQMLRKDVSCPRSSGMGRLFDGVCAILGIRSVCSYEGQGAVLLEAAAESDSGAYQASFYKDGDLTVFDWRPMIRQIAFEKSGGTAPGLIAARFMNTLADMAAEQCAMAAAETGLTRVTLSGGVFQNMYLMERLPEALERRGLEAYVHSRVSCNDEGISLGQIMIGEARYVSSGAAENS